MDFTEHKMDDSGSMFGNRQSYAGETLDSHNFDDGDTERAKTDQNEDGSHSLFDSDFNIDQLEIQQTISTWLLEYALDMEMTGNSSSSSFTTRTTTSKAVSQ